MDHSRVDLRELSAAGAAGAFGVHVDGQSPVPAGARSAPVARAATSPRSWRALGARVVRDAAVAVALMALVPIGLVAVRGDSLARMLYQQRMNVNERVAAVAMARSLGLPRDPSITPMQAGLALNALQPGRLTVPGFDVIEPATRPTVPWREKTMSPDMFATARPDLYDGPSSRGVLEAVAKGFSSREQEYLRVLAMAPVWRDFDLIARAPAVDIIGGRFKIPFGDGAFAEQRPLPSYRETKAMAYAAVSRAAYHMSLGQRDSAESVLRSIVSFGFMFIDNGTSTVDELIGSMIVGIGRDALRRFYVIEHNPRAEMLELVSPPRVAPSQAGARISTDEARHRLLARIENSAVPLGERFEDLRALSLTSCTNVRELMFGARTEVVDAVAKARHTIARYPSEQALVDLQTRTPSAMLGQPSFNPIQSHWIAVSSASVAGVVLHNPRLAACTRILSGW